MAIILSDFKGSFALVTGATAGLGKAFATELAMNGLNLILVARNQENLTSLSLEIKEKYKVEVIALAHDLGDPESYEKIQKELAARFIKIRLLCNNAANGYLGEFSSANFEDYQRMLQLNQSAMVLMSHLFIPDLETHSQSVIINVSSAAAFQPIPYMAVYAATKSFVQNFSQALHWELKEKSIFVQTLTPGMMDTSFNTKIGFNVKGRKGIKTPEAVVKLSLQGLKEETIVVKATEGIFLQKFFANFFPAQIVLKEVAKMFRPTSK